uniref:Apoptosis regulatory protein Siva n=1 Tax=Vannella robusta TaxID=1487602 RepID=A0A7S4MPK1_9EUKA|mmetsp:Transcript_6081/g.7501  ORF Transcript_6081/g.7501 Transcript_6081/m.7501 type:complete len:144 (+) Transcript_6081:26-457(+)
MTFMTSPLKSPFADYYHQQEQNRTQQPASTLRKRTREDPGEQSGTFAWNPTEHKKIRQDVDSIYHKTLHILQTNAGKQPAFAIRDIDFENVKVPSDSSPCHLCTNYTIYQGVCEACQGRVCLECMFQCEVCEQVCCNVCKLTK